MTEVPVEVLRALWDALTELHQAALESCDRANEALLAERAAREEAERLHDDCREYVATLVEMKDAAEARAEQAERERDEAVRSVEDQRERIGAWSAEWSARVADLEVANGRLAEWLSECAGLLHGLWRTPDEFFPVSAAIGDALTRWAKHPSHLIADALAGGSDEQS